MLKKYAFFLMLGPISNALWAWWALPEINEQGSIGETVQWISVQAILPAVFAVLLLFRQSFVLWLMMVYSGFIILFTIGVVGWALMGCGIPISIYAVCLVMLVMGFGILFNSLKDLKVGQQARRYDLEDS
ncbi:MAG: hypothetical protein A3C47_02895 [Omnitrophica bacterium RIFCSPHIGHO2_02_FULL_51_18]|nr:MAG: hypothetical protein A3C47_02895 [Omnitrophica bacterium RIFCSPHIGHO2_02_FULL_51_18]